MLSQKRMEIIALRLHEEKLHIEQFHRLVRDTVDDYKHRRTMKYEEKLTLIKELESEYPYLHNERYSPKIYVQPTKNEYQLYENLYTAEDFVDKKENLDSTNEPPAKRRKVELFKEIETTITLQNKTKRRRLAKRKLRSVIVKPDYNI